MLLYNDRYDKNCATHTVKIAMLLQRHMSVQSKCISCF
jgi:hypothetical protein